MNTQSLSRRRFLQVSALVGGGLLLELRLGGRALASSAPSTWAPNVWVEIGSDDIVTLTIAKSEMGQGVRTSLAMLIAEELDADWSRVQLRQADLDAKYGAMGTGGSNSIRTNWKPLREAGATARALLLAAAAQRWQVPESELSTEPGRVLHQASGRALSYGDLAAAAAGLPLPTQVALKSPAQYRLLGKPQRSRDAAAIVHGTAGFGLDVRLPGLHFAAIARAPAVGAIIVRIDSEAALAVPGVVKVVQVAGQGGGTRVENGVAVIAQSTWAALQGRRRLTIEWSASPAEHEADATHDAELRAALEKTGEDLVNRMGDPDAAIAAAGENVISASYGVPFLAHATMEPQNATAWAREGGIEIWAPTQFPDWAQGAMAQAAKLGRDKITVHVTRLGGGFGRRINPDAVVEAGLVALQFDGPVQVVWDRTDDLHHDFFRPAARHRFDALLGTDGWPTALRHRFASAAIFSTYHGDRDGLGAEEGDGSANHSYRVPARSSEYSLLRSRIRRGWWRGVHTTHGVFAVESFIDELAERAGKDPLDFRLHLIDRIPVDKPAGDPDFPFDPERLKGVLRLAAEHAGWGRTLPLGQGLGIACAFDHLSYAAVVVHATLEGRQLRLPRVVAALDCGFVVDPDGARAQVEGCVVMGLSAALKERIGIAAGGVVQNNFDSYPLLRMPESPREIHTVFVASEAPPTGLGEPALPPVAPALANALRRAGGSRLRELPLDLALLWRN